jgi:4-amino-4-deoxy-L-arabinose transferase-like glycosyltransferase
MGVDRARWLVVPLLVAAALFLPAIGQRTIFISDEARYALLARNMVEHGQWLVPHIDDEVHMEKPPLFMWAIALLSLVTGDVNELTATLPAALSGIGGVAVTFMLGRRLFGGLGGLLAALILATTPGYFWLARAVLADITVAFFVVGSIWFFWIAIDTPESERSAMLACYVCLGLALSAKGPAGLMPLLAFAAFVVWDGGWRGLRRLRLLTGVAIIALIASPWAIAFGMQRDTSYLQTVLIDDYAGPHAARWQGVGELFFAAGPLGLKFLPWSLFLPAALWHGWRKSDPAARRKFTLLLCWTVTYVVVMTIMAHKRERYLLPVYPAVALMVGSLWQDWMSSPDHRFLRAHGWLWAGSTAVAGVALLLPLPLRTEESILLPPHLAVKILAAAGIVVSGALGLWATSTGRARAAFSVIAVTMVVTLGYEAWTLVPRYNARYDVRGFAKRVAAHVGPDDNLLAFESSRLSYDFYLRRRVDKIGDAHEVADSLAGPRPTYVIADERAWRTLDDAGVRLHILEQTQLAGRTVVLATSADDRADDTIRSDATPPPPARTGFRDRRPHRRRDT